MNALITDEEWTAAGAPDDLTASAWHSGLMYSVGLSVVRACYVADTGDTFTPAVVGLESVIDEATGATRAWFLRFARWFTDEVWGSATDLADESAECEAALAAPGMAPTTKDARL